MESSCKVQVQGAEKKRLSGKKSRLCPSQSAMLVVVACWLCNIERGSRLRLSEEKETGRGREIRDRSPEVDRDEERGRKREREGEENENE